MRQHDRLTIRQAAESDLPWLNSASQVVGGPVVVSHGVAHRLNDYPSLIAERHATPVGLATFRIAGAEAELLALAATEQWQGTGSALLAAVEKEVTQAGCRALMLCTTNDNTDALRFYQRRGYQLKTLHAGAFAEVQRIKGISGEVMGQHQIVIRDELVLEKALRA